MQNLIDWVSKSTDKMFRFLLGSIVTFIALIALISSLQKLTNFRIVTPSYQAIFFCGMLALSIYVGIRVARGAGSIGFGVPKADGSQASVEQVAPLPRKRVIAARTVEPIDDIYAEIDRMFAPIKASDDPDAPPDPLVASARNLPIVFSRYFEPSFKTGLSFYGGLPVGPADMQWPTVDANGKTVSLQFMMQWDCRELAAADRTGTLPNDGVLYFFCNTDWGYDLSFRFMHFAQPTDGWAELALPDTVGPLQGKEGAWQTPYLAWSGLSDVERSEYADDAPRVLPKWPMKILPFDYPNKAVGTDDESDDEELHYWNETAAVKEALLELQNSWIAATPREQNAEKNIFERPYPAYPQDWAAVRLIAAKAIDDATSVYGAESLKRHFPETDQETLSQMCATWKDEAKELYDYAKQFPLTETPDQQFRNQVWAWVETLKPLKGYSMNGYALETVGVSLGLHSDGVADIAPDWIENANRHNGLASVTLREQYQHEFIAVNYVSEEGAPKLYEERKAAGQLPIVRDVFARTPARMFGPPSFVQGYIEQYVEAWVLLLEISSGDIDGLRLGDGVLQFVIRPDDLRIGRFDRVELICSAY
jgi:Domain of unknown function (DUF1963)